MKSVFLYMFIGAMIPVSVLLVWHLMDYAGKAIIKFKKVLRQRGEL